MAGEYFTLGQLDCLQNSRIPNALGDMKVRMVYPEYRDRHFQGFGLQTPHMELDIHEALLHEKGILRNALHLILSRVGAWQIECPEFRESHQNSDFLFTRKPLNWHMDFSATYASHRALAADAACQQTCGETNIVTRHTFLDISCSYVETAGKTRGAIRSILEQDNAYTQQALKLLTDELCIQDNTSNTFRPMQDAIAHPDSVIRHFFNANDAMKPNNIAAYSTLAWDDETMLHGTSKAEGQLLSRTYLKSIL